MTEKKSMTIGPARRRWLLRAAASFGTAFIPSAIRQARAMGEKPAAPGLYRVAFCAVGPVPTRGESIEALLRGRKLGDTLLKKAKALVRDEIRPITDIRASKEYREHMAGVMLERALLTAVARLEGRGPAYGTEQL